ncbi:MAG: 16S rRNA (guanine(527)-N(7))-methyltransferase RsmG [Rhodanobacteraceae bacterium]|nr:MAG: 16S rRNA (guanine(527)-N(7))-methyltransferase RsmG [Rhodanobacteraceae bacterium]
MELAQPLATGLAALHLDLPQDAQTRMLAYLRLLDQWNHAYNLTAVRDPADMVARHLLDSLAVLPWIQGKTLADLGSGAGLPGIPLAIARPGLAVTLVESNGKKARFLREAVRSLPLANVRVAQARVQDLRGQFDTITARAFASIPDMLAWAGHLLAPDGRWLALKGHPDAGEMAAVAAPFRVIAAHALAVPGIDAERCLIELTRGPSRAGAPAMVR